MLDSVRSFTTKQLKNVFELCEIHYQLLFNLQTVELKVEMVGIHEKRLRKSLSKLKGPLSFINF